MNDNNIEISGTFSENFLLKILLKTIDSISTDFSTSKIMLYFYENSNEINIYFNKYLINLGDYSFQKYISFNSTKDNKNNAETSAEEKKQASQNNVEIKKENAEEGFLIKIKRLKDKFKSIDYFFFTSPIHFKLSVIHQDIPFIVIFKFNGVNWKISHIIINYEELIILSNL